MLSVRSTKDLLKASVRATHLQDLRSGRYDAFVAAPPANTFLRERHSSSSSLPPLRDHQHPRGLPGLAPFLQEKVRREKEWIDFMLEALKVALGAGVLSLLGFPEQWGSLARGCPASIWDDPRMEALAGLGATRAATFQQDWARLTSLQPSGVLTNAPTVLEDCRMHQGWPQLSSQGAYQGPLPRRCPLPRPSPAASWAEPCNARAPAYPPSLCMSLTGELLRAWFQRQSRQAALETPSVGAIGSQCPLPFPLVGITPEPSEELLSAKAVLTGAGSEEAGKTTLGLIKDHRGRLVVRDLYHKGSPWRLS